MMIINAKKPEYIGGLDAGIEIYSVKKELPHFQPDSLELLLCLCGTVKCTVSHRNFELKQGDFVAINSNEIHYCTSENENILVSLHINNSGELVKEFGLPNLYIDNIWGNTKENLIKEKNKVRLKFLSILNYYINNLILIETDTVNRLVFEMLDSLVKNFQLFYVSDGDKPHSDESKERFDRIISFLKMNYNRKITIDEISSSENISSNYLSQYVKKATLMGITRIITFIRAHESERILLSRNLSIVEVAYECGFSDPKLYYKAFKEVYGCTPKQHRDYYMKIAEKSECIIPCNVEEMKIEIEHYILENMSQCI